MMQWGLVPSWAEDPSSGNKMINARAETLAEKPSFKGLIGKRRCLVLADGFYEWRKEGKGKIPMRFTLRGGGAFQLCRALGLVEKTGWRRAFFLYNHHDASQ